MLTCVSGNRQIDIDDFQSEEQLFELRELSNKGLLRCPDPRCGGIVILHKCNLKRSHFAHRIVGEQCRVCEESAQSIIRRMAASDSEPCWPPNPEHVGHPFRTKAAIF